MQLYNFHRSSASIRVRIALSLKGLPYEYLSVDIVSGEGAHRSPAYRAVNPQGLVPFLVDGDVGIGQSMAILEYLEEVYPEPALLPASAAARARVRSIAQFVVSEMQPINGLRVGKFLSTRIGASGDAVRDWRVHWTEVGFDALEPQLDGPFAVGDTLSLADLCLYGQAWYTRANLGLDLGRWPKLAAIVARMDGMEAVQAALPGRQPDAGG